MLNSIEIENLLKTTDLQFVTDNERIHGYSHNKIPFNIYVKTPNADSKSGFVKSFPVVIHSSYKTKRKEISDFSGAIFSYEKDKEYYHNTNLAGFDERTRKGKKPIRYGLHVNFKTEDNLLKFINFLKGDLHKSIDKDPLTDIKSAEKTLSTVSETTRKAMIDARLGQGKYRRELLELWEKCAVTGYVLKDFLKASHIKPWRDSNDTEKLDKYNGLLLNPILDTAFDKGYISFKNNGAIIISKVYEAELDKMGIDESMSLRKIFPENINYLEFHRENILIK